MKVSIVLSTFNGEKYIIDQLESLRKQTYPVAEVLIRDDCSSDRTVELIKEYIRKYNLDTWTILKNTENRGWKKNFAKLLSEVNGDIIFPCDQDDVWHIDKIQSMVEQMEANEDILLLASNYTPFYEGGGVEIDLDRTDLDTSRRVYKPDFIRNFFHIRRPGCVYAVNRKLLPYFFEVHNENDPHDALLWRLASLMDGLYLFAYSTIDFRRHDNNATGTKDRNYEDRVNQTLYYQDILLRLDLFSNRHRENIPMFHMDVLEKYVKWSIYRRELYEKRKLINWVHLFRFRNLYWSIKSYLADLVVFFKKSAS